MKIVELLFLVGRIFSPLYALVMRIRAWFYDIGLFCRLKLAVPVISVGNLTMGGTGKTPMVIYLCRLLSSKRRVAIVSRGYGGSAKDDINVVSDGAEILLTSSVAGDEPRLLAERLPGVLVITGRKRIITAPHAVKEMGASLIIMDDGFQHMALERDLDLVLFSASTLLGSGWVCPGGPLREPVSALARAQVMVVTGVDQQNMDAVMDFRRQMLTKFPDTAFFLGEYGVAAINLVNIHDHSGQVKLTEEVPVFAFCGIATPQSFFNSLLAEKLQLAGSKCFRDHHLYSEDDLHNLEERAKWFGAKALVTTEKDYVKLASFDFTMNIFVVQVDLRMPVEFDQYILKRLAGQ